MGIVGEGGCARSAVSGTGDEASATCAKLRQARRKCAIDAHGAKALISEHFHAIGRASSA